MASELFVDNITGKTGTSGSAPITLSGNAMTLGSAVTFPSGHVVQTIHEQYHESTDQTSYATVATHIETNITITAGNKVYFNYTIPTRIYANSSAYGNFYYYVYHKTGSGGTYGEINTTDKRQANYYFDETSNLPGGFYRYFNVGISGVHTPSSGTEQYYRIYVKLVQGADVKVGIGTATTNTVVLQEIQA